MTWAALTQGAVNHGITPVIILLCTALFLALGSEQGQVEDITANRARRLGVSVRTTLQRGQEGNPLLAGAYQLSISDALDLHEILTGAPFCQLHHVTRTLYRLVSRHLSHRPQARGTRFDRQAVRVTFKCHLVRCPHCPGNRRLKPRSANDVNVLDVMGNLVRGQVQESACTNPDCSFVACEYWKRLKVQHNEAVEESRYQLTFDAATCHDELSRFRFLRVADNLWVDIRYIERHVIEPMVQGHGTFSGLQDAAFNAMHRQDPEGFVSLNVRAAEHRDGRVFSRAFFLCTAITQLCGLGGPGVDFVNVNFTDGRHTDGLRDVLKAMNVNRRAHGPPHRCHGTGRPGCDGLTPHTQDVHKMIVGDGVESICGQACAELGCGEPPRGNKRFCAAHAAHEVSCAVFKRANLPPNPTAQDAINPNHMDAGQRAPNPHAQGGVGGQWCGEQCIPGSKVCGSAYCQAMDRYYGSTSAGYLNPRAIGETRHQYKSRLLYREEERAYHRFARSYLFGYFVFVCSCGVIVGHFPMFAPENHTDMFTYLDEVLCPTVLVDGIRHEHAHLKRPEYLVYDRMCIVTRGLQPGRSLEQFAARWYNGPSATRMRVDRFHFSSHSPLDEHCRAHCSPVSPFNNPGLVMIHDSRAVTLEEMQALGPRTHELLMSHSGIRYQEEVEGEQVRRRMVLAQVLPGQEGDWQVPLGTELVLLKLADNFNTEAAESTFSALGSVRQSLRSLAAERSECFVGLWVDAYNERTLRKLDGWHDPGQSLGTPRRLWDPLFHFASDVPSPLVT